MIVKDSPVGARRDALVALAVEAPDLHGPELARRAGAWADLTAPGADVALADLVEAVQILRDVDSCTPNPGLYSDEPGTADVVTREWESHRDDALRRLAPAGGA